MVAFFDEFTSSVVKYLQVLNMVKKIELWKICTGLMVSSNHITRWIESHRFTLPFESQLSLDAVACRSKNISREENSISLCLVSPPTENKEHALTSVVPPGEEEPRSKLAVDGSLGRGTQVFEVQIKWISPMYCRFWLASLDFWYRYVQSF